MKTKINKKERLEILRSRIIAVYGKLAYSDEYFKKFMKSYSDAFSGKKKVAKTTYYSGT